MLATATYVVSVYCVDTHRCSLQSGGRAGSRDQELRTLTPASAGTSRPPEYVMLHSSEFWLTLLLFIGNRMSRKSIVMIHLNIWAKSIAITFSKDNYKMLINHTDMEDWEWSLLIMIIINSFINIYFLYLFLFIFDHTTNCRIQSNALPISLQLTIIYPRLSRLRRTRDFPSDETAQLGAAARLSAASYRRMARRGPVPAPVSTHTRHTADLGPTA